MWNKILIVCVLLSFAINVAVAGVNHNKLLSRFKHAMVNHVSKDNTRSFVIPKKSDFKGRKAYRQYIKHRIERALNSMVYSIEEDAHPRAIRESAVDLACLSAMAWELEKP